MLVHQKQRLSSMSSTWEPFLLLSCHFCHPRIPIRINLVFDEQRNIPNSVLFPIPVPVEFLRTVFPTRDQQVSVRTHFVQEELLGRHCLTMTLAICVVEYVSKSLDILTSEF